MKKILYLLVFVFIASGAFLLVNHKLKIFKYDFEATTVNGEVSMKSFDGKYKILYFGYVFCPDVCPTTLTLVSTALNELKLNDSVEILFVTLDLKRDDIKSCDEFAKYFYPNSVCLRFSDSELDRVTKNYGAKYQIVDLNDSVMEYSVAHSSSIYLFDKKGRFIKEVSNLTYENVKSQIQNLVKNH
ncbi:SCO family protein [Campylobacter fetus]|uniref:Photosynthetic protein synthase I n=2 Tax=Campylobacter fetus TaxID=196 RepID=A0AAX0HF12_CAMFE|nr:SCO family protein [Campylobacter fetus]AGZ82052.1 cytochrome oxidase biogenesis protein, Sco1/SenC/PrrC family [Campylobacter fetus subsp. testudinum 03-427]AJB45786.1 photosynthetic protein synthase I [Campylobacter fetus subsp. testudinum]ALV65218.1 cytochrome oxidase biogenesis protein, Sco1/SenC/PrrC family [Campylobacter fetus subsp. testudinum Sp3]AVK81482.1 SCO family protein [Campylobacter fetus subsp. testudinum]EAI4321921.1 SCO family protein [Campylobacter fetus]